MASRQGRAVDVRAVGRFLVRGTRRAAITLIGFTLVVVGLAGLLLPILPGWGLIIGGFIVLSREYSWADSALGFCRRHAARSGAFARRHAARGGASLRSLADRRRPRPVGDSSGEVVIDLTQAAPVPEEADEGVSATG
jgi:hypothetical protein